MVCPKCNAELKEGHLYCENCGAEIRIVPDFEPEIEESMNLSLSGVAEAISEPQSIENEQKKKSQKKRRAKSGKKMMVTSSLAFFALCVVGVIVIGLSRYYSYDYQYEKAMREYESGNFESAVITAKHAVSINPDEEKSKLLLADTYFSLQKYDESIAVLMGMLDLFPDDSDIYERLVANYEIKGDVESIGELIKNCGDNTIMAEFDAYVSVAPSFSIEEGTYYEAEFLSLLSDGNGTIYYTLDGELPDEHSKKYKSPISLKEGTTVVSAIYVNEKGIVSDPVQKTYTIKFKLPKVPVLLTKAGTTIPRY
ncbi:MAG TPA: chitobiase/beta-hexosaminidase C-terminal domain-containing protein [Lachnospiraceae bacterium]|nr:chitobiase/beta-hexosaminidase C-terminal domain-containing protein [Lachnospiraceae bacterium]